MKLMMKIMIPMMKMIPRRLRDRLPAPMLKKARLTAGRTHPTIEMNLTNLLICAANCGTCPSFPGASGEALYCAGGRSEREIIRNGCNCVSCELSDRCSTDNTVYFCINGSCAPRDDRTALAKFSDLAKAYLQRFLFPADGDGQDTKQEAAHVDKDTSPVREVQLSFIGEKDVETRSDTPILTASLAAGIPHTHICGGRARCSTCRVIVTGGIEHCRPRNEKEARLAKIKGFPQEVRLACQTTVENDISLRRLVLDDRDISEAIFQGKSGVSGVGREVDATIMFSDVRSFTSFSEHALPYDIIHILNRYFETIGRVIDANGGYIDKYMGDGIMVIFGLDKSREEHHAYLAAKSAVEMQRALREFNGYLKSHFEHEFRIGIGLHSGTVIVGNLGFSRKQEFTAIGDTVNTASRIESLNKAAGTSILTSGSTYLLVKDRFEFGNKYSAHVKGKEQKVSVYELKY